jgi:thiol-disulfide isomerase/thioredoxin
MSDRSVRLVAAAMVVIVGVWAGARVYLGMTGHHRAGVATPVGEASLPTPSDMVDMPSAGLFPAKIPEHLPAFTLPDLTGKPTPVDRWAGRSLVINFWATWCAPCREEIPMLEDLAGAWEGRGVTVVGIAVDHPEAVSKFVGQLKIPYPVLVGEEDALDLARNLGVATPVFPFTVFTDRRGEVVALYVGALRKPQADLILGVVGTVNDKGLPLDQARRSIAQGLKELAAQPG